MTRCTYAYFRKMICEEKNHDQILKTWSLRLVLSSYIFIYIFIWKLSKTITLAGTNLDTPHVDRWLSPLVSGKIQFHPPKSSNKRTTVQFYKTCVFTLVTKKPNTSFTDPSYWGQKKDFAYSFFKLGDLLLVCNDKNDNNTIWCKKKNGHKVMEKAAQGNNDSIPPVM